MAALIGGELAGEAVDERTAALIRLSALLSVDSDPATFRWAIEHGIAAGVDDDDIFDVIALVAPIIGVGRMNASLPHLMEALDLDLVEG